MEFWGVELKPGQIIYCHPDKECLIHITQVALGETNEGSLSILVSAKIGDQKLIIGTLSAENHPQIPCDLFFEKQFELSHSSKTASVFVCGYKIIIDALNESDSSEDEVKVETANRRVSNPIADNMVKAPTKDDKKVTDNLDSDESDSDSSSTDSDDSDSSSTDSDDNSTNDEYSTSDTSSEGMDTSSEEDSSEEEDKNTPKPEDGKKRVAEMALEMPVSAKKAKIETPSGQDTGASIGHQKVVHVATPHPANQAGKTPGNSCNSCSRASDSSEDDYSSSEDDYSSSGEDSSDEEERNTPKPEDGKNTVAETALHTPASDKEAKVETPSGQDTDDQKVVDVATPHPAAKQASKTPGNSKPNGKSNKYAGGSHACKSCSRTFGSDSALQSHEKAKHA